MGAQFSPDNEPAYLGGGNNGIPIVLGTAIVKRTRTIFIDGNFAGRKYENCLVGDILETIHLIVSPSPLKQFDATAGLLEDCFAGESDPRRCTEPAYGAVAPTERAGAPWPE